MSQPTANGTASWKARLERWIPRHLDEQIEIYETQLEQKRQGKIDDKVFAETRLRRGVYGQRYDNGQRHDGIASRALEYPCGDLTKGPNTVWDAPGMLRIKIPFGAMNGEQMEVLADLAEEYSDSIAHVTTRQDIQLHFIHIDDTPDIMRRLAAVDITTQEACGNSVRNVTACPMAGVCRDEPFDVSPYAHALTHFLLGHKDAQDFGRKFKIAFSGCEQHACGLANMHDLGVVAQVRETGNGTSSGTERGFRVYVGGGLGAVPYQAKVLRDFVREDELLPLAQAVCRVFGRLGEKRNRARARVKFLVAKLGIEEFTRLVDEELAVLPADDRWTAYLDDLSVTDEAPTRPAAKLEPGPRPDGFAEWLGSNVQRQRQTGYVTAAINLPLGDLTSTQLRALADTARRYNGGHVRNTVEQNILLRNISEADLPALYAELREQGLGEPGASSLVDVTACPGTDTCKLGISASRGLAGELRKRIATSIRTTGVLADEAVKDLRIKVSGCFNSCGQHHVADIGFYGVSRKSDGRTIPHFQVILGGQWTENAGSYGLAVVAVPAKRIPEAVERLAGLYVTEREKGESFQNFIARVGKARIRQLLDDLTKLPTYLEDRTLYSDWGDPREYTIGDLGVGECAGEVVTAVEFGLSAAEREVFQGLLELDRGAAEAAAEKAYAAMLQAARALITTENIDIGTAPEEIVGEFRTRFYDTELFFDPYAGAKFANYLFRIHGDAETDSGEEAHRRIEEAQLFIEAAHACNQRISEIQAAKVA
ncbi:MAG: nitrite/sulfite reductase [Holophagales bacterium]|nr:nitrite/sulfite reductase [Holophagales bacterium]